MSLKSYSLPELKKLNTSISREIARREAQAKTQALKHLTRLAAEAGVSLHEVVQAGASPEPKAKPAAKGSQSRPKAKAAPKYRHPSDGSLTWSGRGRQPHWVAAWLGTGRSLESLANAAAR
ncbi:MAG: H-NS histone family protein [Zoogloea sp.]|nr:H-NS histone family protein [Zoogloea sp.]